MPDIDYDQALDLTRELAEQAGRIIMAHWGQTETRRKPDGSEVTDADLAAEECIVAGLQRAWPDHQIVGEEQGQRGDSDPRHGYCWAIDPLDGTRNYARGYPRFATSIALLKDGTPVLGVIREQVAQRTYWARTGCGAFVDGVRVQVAARPLGRDFFVGVASTKEDESPESVQRLLDHVNLRITGSTALHLALVATGAIDAAFARRCHAWDIAAGCVLVQEAGGVCTEPDGAPVTPLPPQPDPMARTPYLAAGPHAHRELVDLLADCDR